MRPKAFADQVVQVKALSTFKVVGKFWANVYRLVVGKSLMMVQYLPTGWHSDQLMLDCPTFADQGGRQMSEFQTFADQGGRQMFEASKIWNFKHLPTRVVGKRLELQTFADQGGRQML